MFSIGLILGDFIGLNIFVFFNSKDWWNEHIFVNERDKLKHELVTHKQFMIGVAIFIAITTLYSTLFVKEEKVETNRTESLTDTLVNTYRMMKNPLIFRMIIIVMFHGSLRAMFTKSNELKFIEYGFDKTTLVNLQSLVLPVTIFLNSISSLFAFKKYLIREMLSFALISLIGGFIFIHLLKNYEKGIEAGDSWMIAGFFLESMNSFTELFLTSKVAQVIPKEIGATAFTVFTTISNMFEMVTESIGLKLTDVVGSSYLPVALSAFVLQVIFIIALWGLATRVDTAELIEFELGYEELETAIEEES